MKNQRNITIFTLVGYCLFFMMLIMTADIARLYAVKVQGDTTLNLALRAACSEIDRPRRKPYGFKAQRQQPAPRCVKKNLDLNSSMYPNPGSICDG